MSAPAKDASAVLAQMIAVCEKWASTTGGSRIPMSRDDAEANLPALREIGTTIALARRVTDTWIAPGNVQGSYEAVQCLEHHFANNNEAQP